LEGIRVLDLTAVVAGPTATMILADLGADVIKVERTDGGDDARHMGPHRGAWGAYFVALNRGKRSIAVDITKPAGRNVVLRLARKCDVFIESFRGGKMDAVGLDEAAVRAERPDIIYTSLSAYGSRGPDYSKPGYDALIQGRTGIVSVTGAEGSTHMRAGVSIVDMSAGLWAAIGILSALLERNRNGRGQRVDGSLFQTGVMLMAYHLVYRQFAGVNPLPQGSGHSAFAPYGAFDASDGSVMIGISNDRIFQRLCQALGCPHWATDPRFATNVLRVQNREDLDTGIQDLLSKNTTAYWMALLEQHDVPASPIQNAEELLSDPQLAALGQMQTIPLPGQPGATASIPRLPFDLSATPAAIKPTLASLGEHGRSILVEAGYTGAEMQQLVDNGVCKLA
jgi:crotonobetainyl-CoA:carnitine CoA-transferase CaiB-like acyl-CoA transferase